MCLKFTEFKDAASLKNNTFDGTKRERKKESSGKDSVLFQMLTALCYNGVI